MIRVSTPGGRGPGPLFPEAVEAVGCLRVQAHAEVVPEQALHLQLAQAHASHVFTTDCPTGSHTVKQMLQTRPAELQRVKGLTMLHQAAVQPSVAMRNMLADHRIARQHALVTFSGASDVLWEAGSREWGSWAKMQSRGEVSEMLQVSSRRGSASPIRFSVV